MGGECFLFGRKSLRVEKLEGIKALLSGRAGAKKWQEYRKKYWHSGLGAVRA